MNLATNARDAMPHGGSLTITTERAKIDEDFRKTHGFGRTGEYVRLSVSDTGIGMDEQTMERIFEPFFTTKEVGKGTGLGLASAYGIVKQHNGYITVSSAPFKGTTFDIYLPLVETPSQQESSCDAGEVKGGTETILIVEDDRDVRNMLTKILESQGYTTIEAIDGDDAIRVYRRAQGEDRPHHPRRGDAGEKRQGDPRRDHPHRPLGQGDLRERLHRGCRHRQGHSKRERRLSPEAPLG